MADSDVSMQQAVRDFDWLGTISKVTNFGRYAIVTYTERQTKGNPKPQTCYGTYVDGKRTGKSFTSFDKAVVGCLAIAYNGLNTQADELGARMLGLPN